MAKLNRTTRALVTFLLAASITAGSRVRADAGASFQGLGFLPGHTVSQVTDLSSDGTIVIGVSQAGSEKHPFRWTVTDRIQPFLWASSIPAACSGDGSIILGEDDDGAFLWTSGAGIERLTLDPDWYGIVLEGLSSDGRVVVGRGAHDSDVEAFRWTEADGMEPLGDLPGGQDWSNAKATCGDGSVIVGWSIYDGGDVTPSEAFMWTEEEEMQRLGRWPGHEESFAHDISEDGSVIVGYSAKWDYPSMEEAIAVRWTEESGIESLGTLSGDEAAFGVSADGSVVVGVHGDDLQPFIWDAEEGMRDLKEYLIGCGLDLTGWTLGLQPCKVSDSGFVIVGSGVNPDGLPEAWRVTLPHSGDTQTCVDLDPDTLNLKSMGRWITCYIELPEPLEVGDIDVSTVMLNGLVPAEAHPTQVGDYDDDGRDDLMVKFDRQAVQQILEPGQQTVRISGRLVDGSLFAATDTIRVIDKGKPKAKSPKASAQQAEASDLPSVNGAPVSDAGDDIRVLSADCGSTVIYGTATDPDGGPLQYRWLDGGLMLLGWSPVGAGGAADLDLGALDGLALGDHDLTLEVTDGDLTDSDSMTLTIENTPPTAGPEPTFQTVVLGTDPVVLRGEVSDFDGDALWYEWLTDGEVLASGMVATVPGGAAVVLPDMTIPSDDPRFDVGRHTVELSVSDSANPSVSASVTVKVVKRPKAGNGR